MLITIFPSTSIPQYYFCNENLFAPNIFLHINFSSFNIRLSFLKIPVEGRGFPYNGG